MRSSWKIGVALAAVAVLGFASPGVAAEGRPFSLQGAGQSTFDSSTGLVNVAASGVATHLGQWSSAGALEFTPGSNGMVRTVGEVTFTAADGDTLKVAIDGYLDPATGSATATFTFIEGTGRFADASGSFDGQVQQYPDGSFTLAGSGAISY